MVDLVFLTTNNVKLAHARHLCRFYDVNIIQHKRLHYGKSYTEPRLFNREELLAASVNDAIARWKKNISTLENRFYFLEDTSVKIHSLSNEDREYPGVDVKYWMRENNFTKVDKELKENKNIRRVTVYSHIILVLTKELKELLNQEYLVFKSESSGTIIDSELQFGTNILYPWLDNKTFNKWFVPEGENLPISLLPIELADKYDFRKGAFNSMLEFLFSNKKIFKKWSKAFNFKFAFNPLFIITGQTCAGKTTTGKYLSEKFGYYHIEASDFMALEYFETHGNKSNIEIGVFASEILKIKPNIVVDRILAYIDSIPNINSIVITGFRTPAELTYFKEISAQRGSISVVYINANKEIRFNRWLKRNRDLDDIERSKFDKINEVQKNIGVTSIRNLPYVENIENNDTLDKYYNLFQSSFLKDLLPYDSMANILNYRFPPKNLEDKILLTLAKDYRADLQEYFTTTEISHKINILFNQQGKKKHKDNVSRCFNQRFYPFYEVKNISGKLKYKLSPTGYSKSLLIMENLSARS